MNNIDKFKEYVKGHPLLKDEVIKHNMTWQEIYENYTLSDSDPYKEYIKKESITIDDVQKETKTESKEPKTESTEDMVKNIVSYVKKINPDNITKYVTSIQKVLELLASFGAGATASSLAKKNTADPLFDRRYDDWY